MHNLKHGTDGEDVVSVPLCHMQCVCAIAGNESENNRVFNQLTDNWQRKDDERMGEDAKKICIYFKMEEIVESNTLSRCRKQFSVEMRAQVKFIATVSYRGTLHLPKIS